MCVIQCVSPHLEVIASTCQKSILLQANWNLRKKSCATENQTKIFEHPICFCSHV